VEGEEGEAQIIDYNTFTELGSLGVTFAVALLRPEATDGWVGLRILMINIKIEH
jgi:hypothetical protein